MTLNELNKHIQLTEELARDTELLEGVRAKAYSVASPSMSGMPHTSGVSQKTEMFAVEIVDLEERIAFLKKQIVIQKQAVTAFCDTIEDIKIRTAFRFRWLYCMSWKEVADSMGPFYRGDSIKNLCYTYLKNETERELACKTKNTANNAV